MAVLLATKQAAQAEWRAALLACDPGLDIRLWPDAGDPASIEAVVMWGTHDLADLRRYPALRLVVSMGAGVDHLLRPPGTPPGVPVARLKDVLLTAAMSEWVLLNILRFHRQDAAYRAQQAAGVWHELPAPGTATRRIGILGLGALGQDAAGKLAALGFPVAGWSRLPKAMPGIACHHGAEGFDAILRGSDMLVCLLPLTPATRGLLDAAAFGRMPRGAFLLNAARGGHVVQADLLAALDSGHLAGAALDVTEPEPLPPDHPFWRHPGIVLTPHAASITIPASVAPQVVENLALARAGRPLLNLVDFERGY